ncbi:MAG: amidohydrolase [Rhodospirillaceae bacterium]
MRSILFTATALVAAWTMAADSEVVAQTEQSAAGQLLASVNRNPYPSTYVPRPAPVTALVGATILDGAGQQIDNGTVVMAEGKVLAIGANIAIPDKAVVVDAAGKWVTSGIIDIHSHIGIGPVPDTEQSGDVNEATSPNTAQVWTEHAVWPQDPAFGRAISGGITTQHISVGSANLFGGRTVVVKNVPARTTQGMKFPGAKQGLKMACGENPKRVYGSKSGPSTRMANFAGYRDGWYDALQYQYDWDLYDSKVQQGDPAAKPPKRDLKLETLAMALSGDILVQMHCYRADEMALVLDMAKEFGYHVTTFHHAVEAYKIADLLAQAGVCGAMWADWWGFKLESFDGIRENIALVDAAENGCAIVHSDSNVEIQRLNQEAAKAMAAGNRIGLNISKARAWTWLSLNPAKALELDEQTGSLEPGKMADVVLWDGDPFSVYTQAEQVYIDGALTYDRDDPARQFLSDFEVGYAEQGDLK